VRIHCIRHGATRANETGRFNCDDDALTDAACVELAAIAFDTAPYDAIFCSPSARAVQTAKCLRIAHYTLDPRLAERAFGVFTGLTPAECTARHPEAFARFRAFDEHFVAPGGESRAQNLARVLEWVREVQVFSNVLAVTHGGTLDFLYRLGTGGALHGGDRIHSGANARMSIFDVAWPAIRLVDFDAPLDMC
jgi:probable phosphoglycerate mutase